MATELLSRRIALGGLAGLLAIAGGPSLRAQEKASESDTQEQNIDTYIGLLRQDVQKQKVAIISQLMDLSPEQAAAFWPVYNEYAKELSALADLRVQGIKEYAANYKSLSDEKATELANMRFEYEERLVALKKKYFEKVGKALTPKLAARFFQVENQLLDVVDLQVASSLPVIE
ncbi:MAG TPA: hypothetical protein VH601_22360 [Bryobacteraceae bacterium]